tara:strand:+ start:95 stop:712 length:618 start_codon:yes stop_codon:yes gene_type:complete
MNTTGIYKITNPKGKVYIGQSLKIEKRRGTYEKEYKSHIGPKLYNSIKKYGFKNHLFEIIEVCEEQKLDVREIYWINEYESVEKGLNLIYGGRGGRPSQETIDKKSKSMAGKKASQETKEKMRKARIGHPMYNDEWTKKMRENVWNQPSTIAKPILQYNEKGELIQEWESGRKAGLSLGIGVSSISSALTGRYKTAGGYIWKYKK